MELYSAQLRFKKRKENKPPDNVCSTGCLTCPMTHLELGENFTTSWHLWFSESHMCLHSLLLVTKQIICNYKYPFIHLKSVFRHMQAHPERN